MKNKFAHHLVLTASLICAAMSTDMAFAQTRAMGDLARLMQDRQSAKDPSVNVAAVSGPSIDVSKTAFVDGQNVCGAIRIKNTGSQPVTVSAIADSLEVHFPREAPPAALAPGSTPGWFKVASVPIPLPGPIAPRVTVTIDYCHSLCLAADSPDANSMRNVVAVTATNASGGVKTVTTRSVSFPPPILDCQACCLPDGSCRDTVPAGCAAAGGQTHGANTECATVQCMQGCCFGNGDCRDATVSACGADGGTSLGLGTTCATDECPRGCCYADGSCLDQSPSVCATAGGRPHAPGLRCSDTLGCTQACCLLEGGCVDRVPPFCGPLTGTLQGPGTECATTECPQGCCYSDGACEDQPPSVCVAAGGRPHEPGSTCADTLGCTQGCCLLDGGCVDRVPPFCGPLTGTLLGPGTECATTECPRPCCYGDGTCADLAWGACLTSGGHPLDPELTPTSCAELDVVGGCPQGCCFDGGHCEDLVPLACSIRGGTAQGPGSGCGGVGCPRGCCHDDGSCSEEPASVCQANGGRPQTIHDENGQHIGIDCAEVAALGGCAAPCCFPDPGSNFCNTIPPDECTSLGGFPRPVSLSCGSPDLCDGACCFGGSCEVMSVQECTEQGGDPQNPGSDCGILGITPCSVIDP